MLIYLSTRMLGKVDVVPHLCHVATEFACAYGFPILPRRSILVFEGTHRGGSFEGIEVRCSGKSVLFAYLRSVCWVAGIFMLSTLLLMIPKMIASANRPLARWEKPHKINRVAVVQSIGALILPFAVLYLTHNPRPSRERRLQLSILPGLPPHLAAKLATDHSAPANPAP